MAYENKGIISKNKKKTKPNHPDITGSINVTEPGEYWVSGWPKSNQHGSYYSLELTKKDQQGQSSTERRTGLDDDSIPF